MSASPRPSHVHTLHRYYIWSLLLKKQFDETLEGFVSRCEAFSFATDEGITAFAYMSYWYTALYVVVEGWKRLGLEDEEIDKLLSSDNVELLKLFRHGVVHFHEDYINEHLALPFISENESPAWVAELSRELGRWFLAWFEVQRANRA